MKQLKLIITALILISPFAANADPLLWTLDYSNPGSNPNMTVDGTFIYDADTNVFGDINVVGIDILGLNILDTTYIFTDPADTNSSSTFKFWDSLAADRTGAKFIQVFLQTSGLSNAGGLISLLATDGLSIFASRCTNATCTGTQGYSIAVAPVPATGTLVGVPVPDPEPTPVPEPGTLALLGLGLAGMSMRRRKKV